MTPLAARIVKELTLPVKEAPTTAASVFIPTSKVWIERRSKVKA